MNRLKSPSLTACDYHFPDGTVDVYFDSVRSWERATRPAPPPTTEAKNGTRTNIHFIEWMMGYPDGWVDGISRKQQLKALGNAVCPQQAEYALSELWSQLTPCAQ